MAWRRVAGSLVSSCSPSIAVRGLSRGHLVGPSQVSAKALPGSLRTGGSDFRGCLWPLLSPAGAIRRIHGDANGSIDSLCRHGCRPGPGGGEGEDGVVVPGEAMQGSGPMHVGGGQALGGAPWMSMADFPSYVLWWCPQGEKIEVEAEEGKTLLEVAHANDIELEGTPLTPT